MPDMAVALLRMCSSIGKATNTHQQEQQPGNTSGGGFPVRKFLSRGYSVLFQQQQQQQQQPPGTDRSANEPSYFGNNNNYKYNSCCANSTTTTVIVATSGGASVCQQVVQVQSPSNNNNSSNNNGSRPTKKRKLSQSKKYTKSSFSSEAIMGNSDFCDVVKQGQLKIKSRNLGLWQRRWIVLRRASSQGPCRLDKYIDRFCFIKSNITNKGSSSNNNNSNNGKDANNPPTIDGKTTPPRLKNSATTPALSNGGAADNSKSPSATGADNNKGTNNKCQPKQKGGQQNGCAPAASGDRCNGTPNSTLELSQVTLVARLPVDQCPSAFLIEFADGENRVIACDTDEEADEWVAVIRHHCLCPSPTGMRKNRNCQSIPPQYDEVFNVFLMPSPKTVISGEVLLQVSPDRIYLWDVDAPQLKLLEWPLVSFKRYGRDNSKFSFEVGSDCFTGEGTFVFRTKLGDSIYKLVHEATLTIAEAQRMKKASKQHHQQNHHNAITSSMSISSSGSSNGGSGFSSVSSYMSNSYGGRPTIHERLHQTVSYPGHVQGHENHKVVGATGSTSSGSGSSSPVRPSIPRNHTIACIIPGEIYDELELLQLLEDDVGLDLTSFSPCNIIVSS